MLVKLFPPTKAKILPRGCNIYRGEAWTSNGYLLIDQTIEPKWLRELKETHSQIDIGKLPRQFTPELFKTLERVKITDNLNISGSSVFAILQGQTKSVLVNAHYVSLFLKSVPTSHMGFYYGFQPGTPVYVVGYPEDERYRRLYGLIMPIRETDKGGESK